jgi:hypothetical protein
LRRGAGSDEPCLRGTQELGNGWVPVPVASISFCPINTETSGRGCVFPKDLFALPNMGGLGRNSQKCRPPVEHRLCHYDLILGMPGYTGAYVLNFRGPRPVEGRDPIEWFVRTCSGER